VSHGKSTKTLAPQDDSYVGQSAKFLKKITSRRHRRAAKKDPEEAPRKKRFRFWGFH